jgi:hypothetical protein
MGALKLMICYDCQELNCVCDLIPGSGQPAEMTSDEYEAYMEKKATLEDMAFDEMYDNLAEFDQIDSGDCYE